VSNVEPPLPMLLVSEIFDMEVKANLVTLSAWETGPAMKSNPAGAPIESPFDRLTVLSNAEGLTAQSGSTSPSRTSGS
jgi:hypothetical protein